MLQPQKTFKKNGFIYNLTRSEGGYNLYEQTKNNTIIGYELHKNKRVLPEDEDFGVWVWSYQSLQSCLSHLNTLLDNNNGV